VQFVWAWQGKRITVSSRYAFCQLQVAKGSFAINRDPGIQTSKFKILLLLALKENGVPSLCISLRRRRTGNVIVYEMRLAVVPGC
jgi:hypothetical protein